MKRFSIILIFALAVVVSFSSCSKKHKREKITDPVQQEKEDSGEGFYGCPGRIPWTRAFSAKMPKSPGA